MTMGEIRGGKKGIGGKFREREVGINEKYNEKVRTCP